MEVAAWFGKYDWVISRALLIEEHACLDFSDFLSTLFKNFHVINKKIHPAHLLTYLVKKQEGWDFFPALLVYSSLLFY